MPALLAPVLSPGPDLTTLSVASSGPRSKDSPEKIRKAATDFEALLIAQMLKSARESGGGVNGDEGEEDETNSTVLELGEQQLAQVLAQNGGLGIAKMVVAGLEDHPEGQGITNHANR